MIAAAIVALLGVIASWITAGPGGVLYVLIYGLATLPGLPVGFMLFGRRHPGGWIAGALMGYVATAFLLWIPIALGAPSAVTFVAAWAGASAVTWFAYLRSSDAAIQLPPWRTADSLGLAITLAIALAVATPPFAKVGQRDAQNDRVYRAYFTADFVWHTALAAELSKFSMPPRNPYLASQPIHYYWTYFLLPATVSEVGPSMLHDVQECLKVNALVTGMLFLAAVFLAAWVVVGRTWSVTIAVALTLLAASAEGSYEMYQLWSAGQSLGGLRDVNIDAITAWHFQGHRIDGLPRCLWYVPQHSMAYALGLMAVAGAAARGSLGSARAILLCGLALAGSTMINPFVGAVFAAAWGIAIACDVVATRQPLSRVAVHALAAGPVVAAVLWCSAAHMADGAGGVLDFGFSGASTHAPIFTLMLSLGPVLLPAIAGLLVKSPIPLRSLFPSIALIVLALGLMYLVRLRVDAPWVPFRAGQMLLVAVPALIARGLAAFWDSSNARWPAVAAFAVLFAVGFPTTAIDARNAQDVENTNAGPGFHWTLVLTPDEQQAFAWIRKATPATAIVQMEPTVRDRELSPGGWGERWSLIPSFAERRMAAGIPISLMRVPEYGERSAQVKTIYQSMDPREAWTIARRLRIVYLYVDALDRRTYEGAAKFDDAPQFFRRAFTSGDVAVYEVLGQSAVAETRERPDGREPIR
jgi:hypothetical protein